MRARSTAIVAILTSLALVGCGSGDGDPSETATPTAPGTEAGAPSPVDLPDGVAAEVGDTEIPEEQVEERVAAVVSQDDAAASEGATEPDTVDPEQREAAVTAQVLGDLIVGHVILMGAEDLGVAPTEEDVDALREEIAAGAGGEEAFMEQAEAAGYDEAAIERELQVLAAFQNVTDALTEEQDGDDASPAPQDQQAVQLWLIQQLEATDIAVDEQYGVWDPTTGQVLPLG